MSKTSRLAAGGLFQSALEDSLIVPKITIANPNVTLTNSIGTTNTQIAFVTIPSGSLSPNSQIEIYALWTKAGTTSLDLKYKFGSSSGNYASALDFAGQFGFTTQLTISNTMHIHNNGSLNSQLLQPAGMGNFPGSIGTALVSASVDTSLDCNIYFGAQYTAAPAGGDTITLRSYRIVIWG
jgi:hypothetical protein